jgi:hypothetical protein
MLSNAQENLSETFLTLGDFWNFFCEKQSLFKK